MEYTYTVEWSPAANEIDGLGRRISLVVLAGAHTGHAMRGIVSVVEQASLKDSTYGIP